jgi:2'-5' RNA ligase
MVATHPGSLFPGEIPYEQIQTITAEVLAKRPTSFAATEAAFWVGGCLHETFRPHDENSPVFMAGPGIAVPETDEELEALAHRINDEMAKAKAQPKGADGDQSQFMPFLQMLLPLIIALLSRR